MNKIRQTITAALVIALAGISMLAQAQNRRDYRMDDRAMQQLIQRIETGADRFKADLASALDQSRLDNTQREDNINQLVADFEQETGQLSDRFNRRSSTTSDVQAVLDRAARIDNFMQRRRLGGEAERSWATLRSDIDQLASAYNISWNWNRQDNNRAYGSNRDNDNNRAYGNNRGRFFGDARMTGTYKLNTSRSMDARQVVENAVRNLPTEQRQRVTEALLRRLDSPDVIAIEKRGRTFNIASSNAPQGTFEADGVEHEEMLPNSQRTSRVRVSLAGDQLTINSTGNRSSDFTVIFDPVGNGNGLRVTRRLYNDRLSQPISVESVYDRTSDVAQWEVYTGPRNNAGNYPNTGNYPSDRRTVRGDYIVPDGMTLVAKLNEDLVTSRARSGDRFTMRVISPSEYEGATIEGSIGNVDRGGRITGRSEMSLNLESITLRNGQSYRFEGTLESARTANGEVVRVDTEGSVRESNQTNRTIKRTAIGTAIGAIIGGIAGGGSGAAIGAAVGAGAGAGSVYVQGRNDLELMSGSELTIRASAPRTSGDR